MKKLPLYAVSCSSSSLLLMGGAIAVAAVGIAVGGASLAAAAGGFAVGLRSAARPCALFTGTAMTGIFNLSRSSSSASVLPWPCEETEKGL